MEILSPDASNPQLLLFCLFIYFVFFYKKKSKFVIVVRNSELTSIDLLS